MSMKQTLIDPKWEEDKMSYRQQWHGMLAFDMTCWEQNFIVK